MPIKKVIRTRTVERKENGKHYKLTESEDTGQRVYDAETYSLENEDATTPEPQPAQPTAAQATPGAKKMSKGNGDNGDIDYAVAGCIIFLVAMAAIGVAGWIIWSLQQ